VSTNGSRARILAHTVWPRFSNNGEITMSQYKLTEEIVARSVSGYWDEAKREWDLIGITIVDDPWTCLCGHYPINEICTIRNRLNGICATVGNRCVKKFFDLPSDAIFQGIKRIEKNPDKALNYEATQWASKMGVINDWERTFCIETRRKRILSPAQRQTGHEINQKVLSRLFARRTT
jgi:hypothetical protein